VSKELVIVPRMNPIIKIDNPFGECCIFNIAPIITIIEETTYTILMIELICLSVIISSLYGLFFLINSAIGNSGPIKLKTQIWDFLFVSNANLNILQLEVKFS
jgi:hypothetical protein